MDQLSYLLKQSHINKKGSTMLQENFEYFTPSRILFGLGQLCQVGHRTAKFGKKSLLVTGRTSMRRMGITDRVIKYLTENEIEPILFDKVESNPSIETANKGAQMAKEESCHVVIGLGGGSAIDAAKAIAVVASHGDNARDFLGTNKVPGPILPLIAIPSTAGTGSEVTRYAVLTDKATNRKDVIRSEFIIPKVAIVDPEAMASQPPYLTSCTGMDALTHAIEAYTSPNANPISDVHATEAICLIASYLRRATWQRGDREARSAMALGSTLAGIAICQAGTGAAHGLGMSVGGLFGTDHGTTVGIILPYVMEYNFPANIERHAYIAVLMGENVESLDPREAALKSVKAVRNLIRDISIPEYLGEMGVKKELVSKIAEDAANQGAMKNNIRKLDLGEIKDLYMKACGQ